MGLVKNNARGVFTDRCYRCALFGLAVTYFYHTAQGANRGFAGNPVEILGKNLAAEKLLGGAEHNRVVFWTNPADISLSWKVDSEPTVLTDGIVNDSTVPPKDFAVFIDEIAGHGFFSV